MTMRTLMLIPVAVFLLALPIPAKAALTADDVRGGWIADLNGQRHVYLLNVRGTNIRGIYCWDCGNPDNLAFVQDGKLEADDFSFVLLHDAGPGAPYRETVKGRVVNGRLVLSAQRQGSNAPPTEMTMMREPRRRRSGLALPGAIAPLPPGSAAPAAGPPPAQAPAPAAPPAPAAVPAPPQAGAAA